jgi:hypothetical protein
VILDTILLAAKVAMLTALLPVILLMAIAHAAVLVWSLVHQIWRAWPK